MILDKIALKIIEVYQTKISHKVLPGCCGFSPTCSHYSKEAIEKYGFFRGGWLSIKRILRCNPLNQNKGYDPVPEIDKNGKLEKIKIIKMDKSDCSSGLCIEDELKLNKDEIIKELQREKKNTI